MMKNILHTLVLGLLLSVSGLSVAQTREGSNQQVQPNANQDSTSIGTSGSFLNQISRQSPQPNNAVVAPEYCQSRMVIWSVGANTCSGIASQTNQGSNRTVVATGSNVGTATYMCNNNSFVNPSNISCVAPSGGCINEYGEPTGATTGCIFRVVTMKRCPGAESVRINQECRAPTGGTGTPFPVR